MLLRTLLCLKTWTLITEQDILISEKESLTFCHLVSIVILFCVGVARFPSQMRKTAVAATVLKLCAFLWWEDLLFYLQFVSF